MGPGNGGSAVTWTQSGRSREEDTSSGGDLSLQLLCVHPHE